MAWRYYIVESGPVRVNPTTGDTELLPSSGPWVPAPKDYDYEEKAMHEGREITEAEALDWWPRRLSAIR